TSFLVFSLLLSLLINRPRRGIGLFRALFFMPWVLSALAVGTAWRWMFNSQSGPFAQLFGLFGAQSPDWLLDAHVAMLAIAIMTTWQGLGYGLTIFLAGLQGVPDHLHEAAQIDGANTWDRFRFVTLPMLSPTILFLSITSLIGAFQLFDPVVAMSGSTATISGAGGPDDSTRTIVLYLFNQLFEYTETISGAGYGAVIAWMLALLIFGVTALQLVLSRWLVYYGD
nr:sugar ABC transporter permease [Chloroflexota bacterium]